MVESLTNGSILLKDDNLRLRREWEKKGAVKPINFEDLREAMYNPGTAYLFTEGILGIKDSDGYSALKIKQALYLEPEDATESVNIIILTDKQRERLLTIAPIKELEEMVGKLGYEQLQELAEYAIKNEIVNMDRCDIIKKAIDVDIIRAVQLNRQNKED